VPSVLQLRTCCHGSALLVPSISSKEARKADFRKKDEKSAERGRCPFCWPFTLKEAKELGRELGRELTNSARLRHRWEQ
jgi:hypothetical protein